MKNNFRYDINGLRAYAVALVVLFHFGVSGFSGGFIGVDVFFVISGFLMTKIIVSNLKNNDFNILKFYLARANRIIPALLGLTIIVGFIGWFTLTPHELKNYAKHAFTSLGFVSNIQYFKEAGYFDASSHEKLLLHTWSLSVEWQFYILLPIFLFMVYRLSKKTSILKTAFVGLFIFSLALSIFYTNKYPTAAFYLLPTRAWEMLAGGLIFLFFENKNFSQKTSVTLNILGFILIASATYLFSASTPWPGYNALIPVVGSFLILVASNQKSLLTNNKIAQFLGNASYSIYLWHWPIVFYLAYFEKTGQGIYVLFAVFLSVFIGWLSYKFIETPSRKWLSKQKTQSAYLINFSYVVIPAIVFLAIFMKNGITSRFSPEIQKIIAQENNRNPLMYKCHIDKGLDFPECKHGTGDIGLIVIGDSHASAIMPGVVDSLPSNKALIEWTYSGCSTVRGIKKLNSPDVKCAEFLEMALKNKDQYPKIPILIINRTNSLFHADPNTNIDWAKPLRYIDKPFDAYDNSYLSTMKNGYINTLCKFSENNDVYVTTPVPVFDHNVPKKMAHKAIIGSIDKWKINKEEHLDLSNIALDALNIASQKCNVKVLDTTDYFCDEKYCYPDSNGTPLYYDDDHLSVYGAKKLTPLFHKIF